ncbi:MAG TPA: GAF domain-containing protein, partial [Gaiellales bacterium]|nr:GAF domain-containing protein [Gaiellales bacterium]
MTSIGLEAELERRLALAERRASVLERVIGAGLEVGSEIALDLVLERIVQAACELTGARYGALGVLDPTRSELTEFVTVGIAPAERRRLGDLPRGRGILGALIRDGRPLRLAELGEDPRSVGFPPGHPSMRSFLGVPIRVRRAPFGNLYLTEKPGGPFTPEDEDAVVLLAGQAAVAIEHARMVEASRRWAERLEVVADVSAAFAREIDLDAMLGQIADRLRSLVEARLVVVELLTPGDRLSVAAVAGRGTEALLGSVAPLGSKSRRVLDRRRGERVDSTVDDPEVDPRNAVVRLGVSAGMWIPLIARNQALGIVTVADRQGVDPRFSDEDLRVAETLAQRAAEAIDQSRRVGRHTVQSVLEAQELERGRLSRELHDQTGQALGSILLGLAALNATIPEDARRQVETVEALVRDALDQVRRIAVELRPASLDDFGLVPALSRLGETFSGSDLKIDLVATFSDATRLPPSVETATYRIVQEAVANAVKHGGAGAITISLTLEQ